MFFFFKQKTAYEMRISDWSSDVCSSDLVSPIAVTVCQKAAVEGRINCACVATPSTINVVSDGLDISTPASAAVPGRVPVKRSSPKVTAVLIATTTSTAPDRESVV